MHVLVTGANGYIGLRLIPELLERGWQVTAIVRDVSRFPVEDFVNWRGNFHLLEGDFLNAATLPEVSGEIDAVFYLLHSMSHASDHFLEIEARVARNFNQWINKICCRQIIFLSGLGRIGNAKRMQPGQIGRPIEAIPEENKQLSQHLRSRHNVEQILTLANPPLTVLRASIIVGSGSASFEIIRSLVEKLPIMLTPRWVNSKCQPIAIRNVIDYLCGIVGKTESFNRIFDIGGEEVLTYQKLLEIFAEERNLKRIFIPVPVMSKKLSAWWVYLISNTTYTLARALVDSLKYDTVCSENSIQQIVPIKLLDYRSAVRRAFCLIAQNMVPSTWFDSLISGQLPPEALRRIHVPKHGVLIDIRQTPLVATRDEVITAIWSLGGKNGWPSMNVAWKLRGMIDVFVGGIGLRRGRRNPVHLRSGDVLDFWRVLLADKNCGRLILYAEMKLPGQAWLEFKVEQNKLTQIATFRPIGIFGRFYWWIFYPAHLILFPKMVKVLAQGGLVPEAEKRIDHAKSQGE